MRARVVDCTLRDGGYCNEWNWTRDQARECYLAAAACGAAVCEVGFRRQSPEKGLLYHCPEAVLHDWFDDIKTSDCALAVMAQMGTFSVDTDFTLAATSPIDMVRVLVAYHSKNQDDTALDEDLIQESIATCAKLRRLGYMVSLNIGRAEKLTPSMWKDVLIASKKAAIDVVYFADTYGALHAPFLGALQSMCDSIGIMSGFHFHNNTEEANLKAREAIRIGCEYIDGTMGGYGRGSGNTKLEYICRNPMPVLCFVDKWLYGYQDKKDAPFQGYNVVYFMTARRGFHVNYAEEVIHDETKRTIEEIDAAFERMSKAGKGAYYVKHLIHDYWK